MKINRILIVDDDGISNHLTKEAIEKSHFADEIIIKTDAVSALEYVAKECTFSSKYPNLILLDLKMPDMDGFEFIEAFDITCKKNKHEAAIVILTGSRMPEDYMKLRKLGKYDVMHKPLTVGMLEDIHHRYFRKRISKLSLRQ